MNVLKFKTLLSLLFCLLCFPSFSQFAGLYPADKPIPYKEKTLIVILDESDEYLVQIKTSLDEVLKEDWSLTPYKVLSKTEFITNASAYVKNDSYIFLSFEAGKVGNTVGGGLALGFTIKRISVFGPQVSSKGEVKRSHCIYVSTKMNDYSIKAGVRKDINNIKGFLLNGVKVLNAPDPVIKEKTIYVNQLQINKRTEADIKEQYPYPVKVVSFEEFSKALEEKRTDVVFFDYSDNSQGGVILIYTLDKDGTILWKQQAKGVNNYVHINFDVLRKKLEKQKED
jgi:hypothetical protein